MESRLTKHINMQHEDIQNVFSCPYCTQPFNHYTGYLDHLKEHKDKVIRCRIYGEACTTISKLRAHAKRHVNQCPFCSLNFIFRGELFEHIDLLHGQRAAVEKKQCLFCEATFDTLSKLTKHNNVMHRPFCCNICFTCFSAEYKLLDHHATDHGIRSVSTKAKTSVKGDQLPESGTTPSVQPNGDPSDQPVESGVTPSVQPNSNPSDQSPRSEEADTSGSSSSKDKSQSMAKDKPEGEGNGETQQVPKLDEVKGSPVSTETHRLECKACNYFLSSMVYSRQHIFKYHSKQLMTYK